MSTSILPTSEENGLVVAAVGDSMISRRLSVHRESDPVVELLRRADVAFTNCEITFHHYESYPMVRTSKGAETMMCAEPLMAGELARIGIDLVSLSNSHALDFGPPGMFSTMKALEESNIVFAGVGRDLDEAGEPKYLETENGRIALVSACYDPFHQAWERASNSNAGVPARPGMNLLRIDAEITVTKDMLDTLRNITRQAGLNPPAGKKSEEKEGELVFLGQKFKLGDKPNLHRSIKKKDLDETLLSIKDAKKSADFVLLSLHSHASDARGLEYPPNFICEYARACLDAGADAFLGHGPHILRGIEIYKKKPIFYSLGNFIAQNQTVKKVTYDQYEWFELGENARPSDFYNARSGRIPPSEPPYAQWWFESVIAVFRIAGSTVTECKLHPITLGFGKKHAAHIGYPEKADPTQAKRIIEHLTKISAQWNTKILFSERIGEVLL